MIENNFRKRFFRKKSDCSICYSCNSLDPPLQPSYRLIQKISPLYDTNAKCIVAPFSHYDTTFNMSYMKNIQISIDRQESLNE